MLHNFASGGEKVWLDSQDNSSLGNNDLWKQETSRVQTVYKYNLKNGKHN